MIYHLLRLTNVIIWYNSYFQYIILCIYKNKKYFNPLLVYVFNLEFNEYNLLLP